MALGVVIPAHDEQHRIGQLLGGLAELVDGMEERAEVVVICNGCTDATAAIARRVAPWAAVYELAEASKPAALRLGDSAMTAFPRLYLDADVQLDAAAIQRLAAALGNGVEATAPTPRYETTGARLLLRSHYWVWTALQARSGLIAGTGAMMVTASGRSRFGEWPDVLADDFFLDGQFSAAEKRRLPDVEVVVTLPRSFVGCASRRARVRQGNQDLLDAGLRSTSHAPVKPRMLNLFVERPMLLVHLPGHVVVTVAARLIAAWRRRRGRAQRFFRDTSSRR